MRAGSTEGAVAGLYQFSETGLQIFLIPYGKATPTAPLKERQLSEVVSPKGRQGQCIASPLGRKPTFMGK